MVFTIEPGVYVAGVGGFRHSDTVVVRPDGIEVLTDYPSDIESSRSRSEGGRGTLSRDDGRLARTRAATERLIARFPLMRLGKRVGDAHLDP